ncbi:hypothetical protein diail_10337 [Diaporthe ilicicola]|nr:hypothetical protein diail_10337 [Diaporthe ilicicola]
MAYPYSSKEELVLPFFTGHQCGKTRDELAELDSESIGACELPAEDVSISSSQQPWKKAPRPNRARRTFRHAQLVVNQWLQRQRRPAAPRDERLPLSTIELILKNLDIRGAAGGDGRNDTDRRPLRPCPDSANGLYDRLELSRSVTRRGFSLRLLGRSITARPAWYVTSNELPRLLAPVLAEMKACLGYIAAFRARLDIWTEGRDHWLDLSHLRMCVFRLTGFWPHDVNHDLEAWSFGLPDDLTRLLYPQCGVFDHREMAMNLEGIVLGPGREAVNNLEGLLRLHRR